MSILVPDANTSSLLKTSGLPGISRTLPSKTSADFNMFLKMLTTQMQNQDPLDPMDTSEYTNQLVQFSQVEQTIQQTGTLRDILSRLTTQDMAQASGFIGREAQFGSPIAGLSSTAPATWGFDAARPIATLVATITNAAGTVVDTRAVALGDAKGRFAWNGLLPNGDRAPDGAYTVSFKGADEGGANLPVVTTSFGIVDEVVTDDGAVSLGTNGVRIPIGKLVRVSRDT